MARLRVDSLAISLDGFIAGPNQGPQHPLGVGGEALHEWAFATRAFRERVLGQQGGETGVDDDFAARGFEDVGAWIMGRNMFGPLRGPWPDDSWRGWWGDDPPFHGEVFVLTHHPRDSFPMGDTTFHFITGGIHEALERARDVAGDEDVRLSGGAQTIRQYLQERLVDRMHLALAHVLLGQGENLLSGLDLPALGYTCDERVEGHRVTHFVIGRRA